MKQASKTVPFRNARYEYITREFPTTSSVINPEFEADLNAQGWYRAWADITNEGTFAVYRREVKT